MESIEWIFSEVMLESFDNKELRELRDWIDMLIATDWRESDLPEIISNGLINTDLSLIKGRINLVLAERQTQPSYLNWSENYSFSDDEALKEEI